MKKSLHRQLTCVFSSALFCGLVYSAADEIKFNKGLPVMVDNNTELNDIVLRDKTITFTYELKDIDFEKALQIKEVHKNNIEKNACEDENVQRLFYKDLDVSFIYKIQGNKVLEVAVNKEYCNLIGQVKQVDFALQNTIA